MFLDTSGLFSLFDVRESHHLRSMELLDSAKRRLTTNYVLVEFVSLVLARKANLEGGLRFIENLQQDPSIQVEWVDPEIHATGMDLIAHRMDKTYSLCDTVSFTIMNANGITEALTTDHHFEQEGFVRLLK